jgi:hypothetical protein
MDTKLTLKLDKTVIEKAKEYASNHQRSLSGLIESFLQSLLEKRGSHNGEEIPVSPFVKSISSGVHIPADLDLLAEYHGYLTEKYR